MNNYNNKKRDYSKCEEFDNWRESSKQRRKDIQKGKRDQDPYWYAKDSNAISKMASLPWNEVIGARITGTTSDTVPGMVIIPTKHTVGSGLEDFNDAVTRTANAYFQYMTQGFTGVSVDFEGPDLMFTALAAADLVAFLHEGKRAMGVLKFYTDQNAFWAKAIFEGLGFSYDSFTRKHSVADFETEFNIAVNQINKIIAIPDKFYISDRWRFLADYLFVDSSDPEFNTIFAFVNNGILDFDDFGVSSGSSLDWLSPHGFESDMLNVSSDKRLTFEQFFEYVNLMIKHLSSDSARGIFAALRRVYKPENFYHVEEFDPNHKTEILRSDIVSAIVHNADYMANVFASYPHLDNVPDGANGHPVIQIPGGQIVSSLYGNKEMISGETARYYADSPDIPHLIDMFGHMDTPENVLDVTTGMIAPISELSDALNDVTYIKGSDCTDSGGKFACRADVFMTPIVLYRDTSLVPTSDNPDCMVRLSAVRSVFARQTNGDDVDFDNPYISYAAVLISHMNSAPFLNFLSLDLYEREYLSIDDQTITGLKTMYRMGEVDKYTTISNAQLALMHARSFNTLVNIDANTLSTTDSI